MVWTVLQRWIIAGLCILISGCTVWDNALRTTHYEPSLFSHKHDRRRSLAVYRTWAEEAWQQEWQAAPELGDRPAYGQGFRDGFVDYTFAGGTGEPPPVPPRKLWNVFYRSEEGHQRAADWFAGYRHGAQVSRDGGYRSLSTLRSSLFGYRDGAGDGHFFPEMSSEHRGQPFAVPDEVDTLPAPTTLPPPSQPGANNNKRPSSEPADVASPPDAQDRQPGPPPPQELPPANPTDLDLPETKESGHELSLELEDSASAPAVTPAAVSASYESPTIVERIQLSMPEKLVAPEALADEPARQETTMSSVRIVGGSAFAGGIRKLRPVASPPMLFRPRHDAERKQPRRADSGVRLTSTTSDAQPVAATLQVSTIEIHEGTNALRDAVSAPPTSSESPFVH